MKKFLVIIMISSLLAGCKKEQEVITEINLDKFSLFLTIGEQYQYKLIYCPENLPSPECTWQSSDEQVVSVNDKGIVRAVGKGTATITVTTLNGGLKATSLVTVIPVSAKSITLDKTSLDINVGETSILTYQIDPDSTTYKEVIWSSDNTQIATVDNGTITAVKPGTTTIRIKIKNTTREATCSVTVNPIRVSAVTLDKTNIQIIKGNTTQLTVTVNPVNATNKNVSWSSSDNAVATVDQGKITGISAGEATITLTTEDGSFKASCLVKVLPVPVSGVLLDKQKVIMMLDESYKLTATVQPTDAGNKSVTWSSSDPTIASVDANGNILAKGLGSTQIKVTTGEGNFMATCTVEVVTITGKISLSFTGSTVSINGWVTGSLYSIINNTSKYPVTLTKFEIIDSYSNTVKISSTDPTKLGVLEAGKSTNLGTSNIPNLYKPIFKWYFTYNGQNYTVQHQYGI